MINIPLLRKELEFIRGNPELHNQSFWRSECGTYGCLAGNTVIHAVAPEDFHDHNYVRAEVAQTITGKPFAYESQWGSVTICDVARELLGLDRNQASELFNIDNTEEDLWRMANNFTNGEIEIPNDYC